MRSLVLLFALLPMVVLAGVDDCRVVESVSGRCEARGDLRTASAGKFKFVSHWVSLERGVVIGPGSEIRTGRRARLVIRLGDSLQEFPGAVKYGETIGSKTLLHLNPQGHHRPIVERVHGVIEHWRRLAGS